MSGTSAEWIIVLLFFLLVTGFTVAEAVWLSRKGWAGFGKSLAFAAFTNIVGISFGFFVVFVCLVVMMMMVFESPFENPQTNEYSLWAILGFAFLFTPVLLTLFKRIFLSLLKMQNGKWAWAYAVVSSVSILVVSLGIPFVAGYFLFR